MEIKELSRIAKKYKLDVKHFVVKKVWPQLKDVPDGKFDAYIFADDGTRKLARLEESWKFPVTLFRGGMGVGYGAAKKVEQMLRLEKKTKMPVADILSFPMLNRGGELVFKREHVENG